MFCDSTHFVPFNTLLFEFKAQCRGQIPVDVYERANMPKRKDSPELPSCASWSRVIVMVDIPWCLRISEHCRHLAQLGQLLHE